MNTILGILGIGAFFLFFFALYKGIILAWSVSPLLAILLILAMAGGSKR